MDFGLDAIGSGSLVCTAQLHGLGGGCSGPLMFCGFALVHARAAVAGQGTGWLTALYLLWLVIDPVKLALLGIVVIYAVLNFRGRWKNRREAGGE